MNGSLQEYLQQKLGDIPIPLPGQYITNGILSGHISNVLIQLIGEAVFIIRIAVTLDSDEQIVFELDNFIESNFSVIEENT